MNINVNLNLNDAIRYISYREALGLVKFIDQEQADADFTVEVVENLIAGLCTDFTQAEMQAFLNELKEKVSKIECYED